MYMGLKKAVESYGKDKDELDQLSVGGLSRREFMKFCAGVAATMGLSSAAGAKMVEAVSNPAKRPPVIWLSGQECTGCSESLLRATHPTLENLILDAISLDYHEALSTPAGQNAEDVKHRSMHDNKGKYLLVIEGAIPVKDDGIYCMIAGKTFKKHVEEAAEHAAGIIAMGSCASWGGMPSADPNPTGATGAPEVLAGKPVITIPGCPPNPYNFLSTILHFVTFDKWPELDHLNRPTFAYNRLIHENCERRPHFDAGRFALEFGDEGHRKGYCLYKIGCKGPETYANCPSVLFGDVGPAAWPVGTGHPCFGCTEPGVGFSKPIHSLAELKSVTPPLAHPPVDTEKGEGMNTATVATVAGVAGAAVGAAAVVSRDLGKKSEKADFDETE